MAGHTDQAVIIDVPDTKTAVPVCEPNQSIFIPEAKGLLVMEAASITHAPLGHHLSHTYKRAEDNTEGAMAGFTSASQVHKPISGSMAGDLASAPHQPLATKGGNSWPLRAWRRLRGSLRAYGANVRRQPWLMLGPPLLLFAVCVALGVYGVVAGATKEADDRRTVVYGAGLDWTASFRLSLEKAFTPLVTLSLFIRQDTNYTNFAPKFASLAQDLISTLPPNSIQELQVSPMGIISSIYPFFPDNSTGRFQQDIFNQSALRGGAVMTVEMRQLMLNGPLYLINGGNYAAIVRLPIFIQNASVSDTWGTNKTEPTDCPLLDESNPAAGTYCWNSVTHEKFWGFVTAILPLDDLRNGIDSRLDVLKQKGYLWRMTRPYTNTEANPLNLTDYTFANSSKWPSDPVVVRMVISNAEWTIYLEPDNGWTPSWLAGMIVLVVLGSTVLSLLVAVIMASWAQQKRLLSEVMESNAALAATTQHLEEEKLRLDALLVRQYNLLSVLGGGSRGTGKKDGGSVSEGGPMGNSISSKEGLTLERIELMRRQLAVNTNSSTADIESIQTLELLGEGTFGKVYKGLWRGTVVAVKTMMLPANMSGAEKREKMAVMEAAISSSLSHPNIVQTYTYAIKPIRDGDHTPGSSELLDGNLLVAGTNAESTMIKSSMNGGPKDRSTSTTSSVHSYEVRLVLEYCDGGCLRDALDDGVFMGSKGLNYCAVLDIAADVAKAMLHLHSLNVLHADLKARNVLLKSEGSHGSSVIAKVADFGLSLKMDHMETHISAVYQGTMTHMAPEILLDGHVSKAADVYAFGITMWELFTGGHAFAGVPRALMGHQIAKESLRPRFPEITPPGFRSLAERCWHPLVDMRPTFTEVLDSLVKLRTSEGADTPALELHAQRARSANGGVALPPTAGISPHAPQGTDGAGCATVVRQRPLALPKIQEASGGTEDEDDSAGAPAPPEPCPTPAPLSPSARVPSAGSDGAGVEAGPTITAPTQAPSAAHQSRAPLTGPGFTHGQGPVAGASEGGDGAMSLPSGIQVTNASMVGDSIWK